MKKNDIEFGKKLSYIVDQSPVIIAITDKDGLIEYVNKPFTEITGYSFEEVAGKKFSVLKSGFHGPEFYENINKTISAGGEWRGEIYNKKKNGEMYWEYASIYALKDEKGAVTNYVKIAEDATERKNMQDSLKETRDQFRSLFDNSPTGILLIDKNRIIKDVNKKTEEIFGYKKDELIGQKADILIPEYIREKHSVYCGNFFSKEVARPMGIGMDLNGIKKSGENIPLEVGLSFIKEKESVYVLASLTDITLRKKAQEELQKTRDEFTAMLTHDLKSPLTAIIGFSEILSDKDTGELPPEKAKYLDMMRQSGDMMLNIINNIVGATRIESGKMVYNFENFPPEKLLEDLKNTFTPMSKMKDIKINFECDKEIIVYADREKIMQVLQNLVSNAFRYTPSGGEIKISASRGNGFVNFTVSDTGSGIPKEEQGKLFQKFTQVKGEKRGTGLGLYIVKKILEGHGSTVGLESAPGEGTKFYFQLKIK